MREVGKLVMPDIEVTFSDEVMPQDKMSDNVVMIKEWVDEINALCATKKIDLQKDIDDLSVEVKELEKSVAKF